MRLDEVVPDADCLNVNTFAGFGQVDDGRMNSTSRHLLAVLAKLPVAFIDPPQKGLRRGRPGNRLRLPDHRLSHEISQCPSWGRQ